MAVKCYDDKDDDLNGYSLLFKIDPLSFGLLNFFAKVLNVSHQICSLFGLNNKNTNSHNCNSTKTSTSKSSIKKQFTVKFHLTINAFSPLLDMFVYFFCCLSLYFAFILCSIESTCLAHYFHSIKNKCKK